MSDFLLINLLPQRPQKRAGSFYRRCAWIMVLSCLLNAAAFFYLYHQNQNLAQQKQAEQNRIQQAIQQRWTAYRDALSVQELLLALNQNVPQGMRLTSLHYDREQGNYTLGGEVADADVLQQFTDAMKQSGWTLEIPNETAASDGKTGSLAIRLSKKGEQP